MDAALITALAMIDIVIVTGTVRAVWRKFA